MRHPYRIREIAEQAGLSQATVDRVLHGRPGVRASTVAEVQQAIADLHRQRSQLRLTGHTLMLDLVMQAPARFSTAVRKALEAGFPLLPAPPSSARAFTSTEAQRTPPRSPAPSTHLRAAGPTGVLLKATGPVPSSRTPSPGWSTKAYPW